MLLRFITWALVIYFLLRFISRFVLPVFKITRMTNDRLRDMQRQMEDMHNKVNNNTKQQQRPSVKEGDYVDFEEIK